ncbi:YchJ family protein [Bordetella petrii]|uniref:UPF0225 protein QUC21_18410 n=1 Tax=Bordetella petrii TaxID=94624 RepID=A0ABT7W734_9BORD|nr:YchJ family metal-binding protein [Bordetella petrii]MDM9561013.1 YchJ family metal-binding protein [Bordetella petrii]
MTTPTAVPAACPCGSGQAYSRCCEPWHRGPRRLQAPSAVALMRSRYSAFVLDELQYLLDTWHPHTRPARLDPNPPDLKWLGLQVKQHAQQDAAHATVEFVARYRQGGRATRLHELSRFELRDGRWFYLDGEHR